MKTVTPRGYDERTLVNPQRRWEVYGAEGYGWYAYAKDVAEIVEGLNGITLTPSENPLFVYMDGITLRKLRDRGFTDSETD